MMMTTTTPMTTTTNDGWSTVASVKKRWGGPAHTAMAPRLPPIAPKNRATKLTFSEMQEELERSEHVAINVAPSIREIRKEAAREAEKGAPTTISSYVQFPTLGSSSNSSASQKPKASLDFRAVAVAAASKPTPPNTPITTPESPPFSLRSTVPVGPDRIVWVEDGYYGGGYAGGYAGGTSGYEFDETAYDMEPMWEEDENGEEYITDERGAFNSRRYGDNSDW